jgi:hypothetical protein
MESVVSEELLRKEVSLCCWMRALSQNFPYRIFVLGFQSCLRECCYWTWLVLSVPEVVAFTLDMI